MPAQSPEQLTRHQPGIGGSALSGRADWGGKPEAIWRCAEVSGRLKPHGGRGHRVLLNIQHPMPGAGANRLIVLRR